MACSMDGFIAGPDDDLAWLSEGAPAPTDPTDALGFDAFMAQVGAMLMGRRTYEVVAAMGAWPYGDTPVLVPTHRPLDPVVPTVRAIEGDIRELVAQATEAAGDNDVYLDGGTLIRQALNEGLVDELCMTLVPILLGDGIRLFDGLNGRTRLAFTEHHSLGGMVQLTVRPR